MPRVTTTTTEGLLAMNKAGKRLNRGMTREGERMLDPDGVHVLAEHLPHGPDSNPHLRTLWLAKRAGQDAPVEVWVDTTFKAFHEHTAQSIVPAA